MNQRQLLRLSILILIVLASQLTVLAQPARARVAALAIDPKETDTVYAGTGGAGVFKSTDGGGEWREINNGFPPPPFGIPYITGFAIDPVSTDTVYAATLNSIYKTTNSGSLWTRLEGAAGTYTGIAIDPSESSIVYAEGGFLANLIKSTDGGDSWQSKVRGFFIAALAIDPIETSTVYIGTATFSARVFKSTDGGDNWNLNETGIFGQRVTALVVDPESPDVLYAGVRDPNVTFSPRGVYKSANGGANWSRTSLQEEITALALDTQNTQVLYAGTATNGVFKSENGGGSWRIINMGLTNRSINAVAINPKDPAILYVGTEGGGVFKSENGGETWSPIGP